MDKEIAIYIYIYICIHTYMYPFVHWYRSDVHTYVCIFVYLFATLSLDYELIPLFAHSMSMGFVLGTISSLDPPLILGTTELHNFQERLSPATLLDGATRHSTEGVAVIQLLAQAGEVGTTPGYCQFSKYNLRLGGTRSCLQPWLWVNPSGHA